MAKDRIYIDAEDRPLYDRLEKEKLFKGRTKRELFLFAMSIGAKHDASPEFKSKAEFFHLRDLKQEDEAVIKAIVMHKTGKKHELLADKDALYLEAERYANAGIKLLINEIDSKKFGSYEIQLEKNLFETFNKIKNKNN